MSSFLFFFWIAATEEKQAPAPIKTTPSQNFPSVIVNTAATKKRRASRENNFDKSTLLKIFIFLLIILSFLVRIK